MAGVAQRALEYPKIWHDRVRGNILEALHDAYRGKGMAGQVLPFRSRDEQRVRVADVAWISKEQMRRARVADDDRVRRIPGPDPESR